jgi:thioesterase domain-containing protein/acyl carrier protein
MIDWTVLEKNGNVHKIPLPTYPFDRKSYWISPSRSDAIVHDDLQRSPAASKPNEHINDIIEARSDLELQIADIYRRLLGVPRIDIRDEFFDIGGDSFLATQLLAELSNTCVTDLSLADLFENPSVEALAGRVERGGGKLRSSILPLNAGSGDRLVYFVVGIQLYKALANELEDIASCYGVYLPVEETLLKAGVTSGEWSAEILASAYCEEIIKHSKGRPLSLIGVSFGGVVAYEIARKLAAEGRKVPLLVMLDSLLPSGTSRNYLRWIQGNLKSFMRHGTKSIARKIAQRFKNEKPKSVLSEDRGASLNMPDQRLIVYANAVQKFEETSMNKSYGGRVLLVRAEDVVKGHGVEVDVFYGWKKNVEGELNVVSVPGDHLGILRPPNVKQTASSIKSVLSDSRLL